MAGDNDTGIGKGAKQPVADLATMMTLMQNLLDIFEHQVTLKKKQQMKA